MVNGKSELRLDVQMAGEAERRLRLFEKAVAEPAIFVW